MIIEPQAAETFIQGYSRFLVEVYRLSNGKSGLKLLNKLAAARDITITTPSIVDSALSTLEKKGNPVPPEVVGAIKSLRYKLWIYLRDTTAYSVFMEPSGIEAYAVLGLTDRIRDLIGGSGVSIETGIVEYCGHFVCDGLIANPVWLGTNYRKDFTAVLTNLRKEGGFHVAPTR